MHVAILAPATPSSLADLLLPEHQTAAISIPNTNSTAPARLAAELVRKGHRVTVVTYAVHTDARLQLDGDLLTYIQVGSRSRARRRALTLWRTERRKLRRELKVLRPEVVHAHWTYEYAYAAIQSRLPTVITIRDAPLTVLRHIPTVYRAVRLLLAYGVRLRQRKARFTAVSPYVSRAWRRQTLTGLIPRVIPNMMPLESDYGSEVTAKYSQPTIVEIANDSALKNVASLIAAFATVRQAIPDARLLLVGEGLGEADDLAKTTRYKNLESRIEFLGPQSPTATQRLLQRSWVHAHVSQEESFGNTILESIAARTAVVAGRSSGAPAWLLNDGTAGLLVDVKSPSAIAEAIIALLRDPGMRRRLEQSALEFARSHTSPAVVTDAYVDEYRTAIARLG